jgi:calcineurin-like phosphoesterase family protein
MKTFVISDQHYGHSNIIKFCDRPFADVAEMDEAMMRVHNETVHNDDLVIFNGDFMFYKKDTGIFEKLKGRKVLVKGNHDHSATKNLGWQAVHDIYDFTYNQRKVVMCHYPIHSWNGKFHGSIHLYGHVHNNRADYLTVPNAYNICVEEIGYAPVFIETFTNKEVHSYKD